MKRVAHFNRELIWSAYSSHARKDNIEQSHEDLFLNKSYGTLSVQTITLFIKNLFFENVHIFQ